MERSSDGGLAREQTGRARRGSTTTVESGGPAKKRRRPSVVHPVAIPTALSIPSLLTPPTSTLSTNPVTTHPTAASTPITNGVAEEEHVDIDTEPWTATYVPITKDIIPDDETRSKLRRQARAWRGITAVSSSPPPFVFNRASSSTQATFDAVHSDPRPPPNTVTTSAIN